MYDNRIFIDGAYSVLLAEWNVRLETPLAIRNGERLTYTSGGESKERGVDLQLHWQSQGDQPHEVSALYQGGEINNGNVESYHLVPPSSVRGALRSWVVRHIVPPDLFEILVPQSHEGNDDEVETVDVAAVDGANEADDTGRRAAERRREVYEMKLLQAQQERRNGYHLVASLFGFAADTQDASHAAANAGRLRVETDKFVGANLRTIDVAGAAMPTTRGPSNVARQMTVRNPLDRMTHASRNGGLHHFLEFSRGTTFDLRLKFLNVQPSDLALLHLWRREIESGLLRLGALSSIGRGRISIQRQRYRLWRRPKAPWMEGLEHFEECQPAASGDILEKLWKGYDLNQDALASFEVHLFDHVWER